MFGSPFAESRLKSIRAIGHLMYDDQVKQLFVKTHSNTGALSSLDRNDWLKRFECLNCSFEADRPWLSAMPRRSLRNDGALTKKVLDTFCLSALVGVLQFLGPTVQFVLSVFVFGEPRA